MIPPSVKSPGRGQQQNAKAQVQTVGQDLHEDAHNDDNNAPTAFGVVMATEQTTGHN